MNLVSVNVGMPRLLSSKGATFKTGIFKKPVAGRIMLRRTNLDGDRQADLSVHGGPRKAVYGYPSEHYPCWRKELSLDELPWGSLGENFTTAGLLETGLSMGDRFRLGSAEIVATTPRMPCYKLAAKFQRDDIIQTFLRSGFSGFYFSVAEEGEVGAGDEFQLLGKETPSLTIAEINHLYFTPAPDVALLKQAVEIKSLPESWRERFQSRIEAAQHKQRI